ncbi:hypothetical protein NDU88_003973 [Pleurodeles waltl]|uniref:Uncharacterized protein n=1 Tax=Pleurodeles waltl TaxID=8319 RepID=A0AAV7W8H6_PLEWA|nr:hypothetical protein NDU88_003973 [Pleurodeles waltl]
MASVCECEACLTRPPWIPRPQSVSCRDAQHHGGCFAPNGGRNVGTPAARVAPRIKEPVEQAAGRLEPRSRDRFFYEVGPQLPSKPGSWKLDQTKNAARGRPPWALFDNTQASEGVGDS